MTGPDGSPLSKAKATSKPSRVDDPSGDSRVHDRRSLRWLDHRPTTRCCHAPPAHGPAFLGSGSFAWLDAIADARCQRGGLPVHGNRDETSVDIAGLFDLPG